MRPNCEKRCLSILQVRHRNYNEQDWHIDAHDRALNDTPHGHHSLRPTWLLVR